MTTPRIDALDLRPTKVIKAESRQAWLDQHGWWTDWDAIDLFERRTVRVSILADTSAFQESMRKVAKAIQAAMMGTFAITTGFKAMTASAAEAQAQQLRLQAILGVKPRPWWRRWL